MTVTEFLDTKMDKNTDDIILVHRSGSIIKMTNYDDMKFESVVYKTIAMITIDES